MAHRSDKTLPFLGDLKTYRAVKTGDLVTVAMYRTANGENMVGSPDWLNQTSVISNAPNSKSRTRAVSALVVESHPRLTDSRNSKMIHVVCEGERLVIPLASVVEVYECE